MAPFSCISARLHKAHTRYIFVSEGIRSELIITNVRMQRVFTCSSINYLYPVPSCCPFGTFIDNNYDNCWGTISVQQYICNRSAIHTPIKFSMQLMTYSWGYAWKNLTIRVFSSALSSSLKMLTIASNDYFFIFPVWHIYRQYLRKFLAYYLFSNTSVRPSTAASRTRIRWSAQCSRRRSCKSK